MTIPNRLAHCLGLTCLLSLSNVHAGAGAVTPARSNISSHAPISLLMVPAAAPGVYTERKLGPSHFRLTVSGHKFTSRNAIEQYLAYRAAELTMAQRAAWFTLAAPHVNAPAPIASKGGPAGPSYAFKMDDWRPAWRFKQFGDPNWTSWKPNAGAPFPGGKVDLAKVSDFEVSADITVHRAAAAHSQGAFDAQAVADLLAPQVSPPT